MIGWCINDVFSGMLRIIKRGRRVSGEDNIRGVEDPTGIQELRGGVVSRHTYTHRPSESENTCTESLIMFFVLYCSPLYSYPAAERSFRHKYSPRSSKESTGGMNS